MTNPSAGRKLGRAAGSFSVTDAAATRLIRLPMFADILASEQERVVEVVVDAIRAVDNI